MSPSQRYPASAATSTPASSEETHHETPMEVSEGADGSELQEKKVDNETGNQPPTGLKIGLNSSKCLVFNVSCCLGMAISAMLHLP